MPTENRQLDPLEALIDDRFRLVDRTHPAAQKLYAMALERSEIWSLLRDKTPERKPVAGTLKKADMAGLFKNLKLPPLPQILIELQRVMNDPDSSAKDLAEVISKDPKLTATLLRVVNSALYSFPSQIETVSRAVTVVGMRQLSTLATGMLLLTQMNGNPDSPFALEMYWKHSIACGILSRKIAQRCSMENPERYFVAGLLHDIGIMTMASVHPDLISHAFLLSKEKDLPMYQAEEERMGFDHAKFGAYLLRKWEFPPLLVAAVAFHHAPGNGQKYTEPKVLHVANVIANGLGYAICGDVPVPPLDHAAFEELAMGAEDLQPLVTESEEELQSAFEILLTAGT